MPRLIAFLRAVNVGGRSVKMDVLREIFEGLGFQKVQTFIASGNVIFDAKLQPSPSVTRKIETRLLGELGFEVDTFLRTADEVRAAASMRPFAAAAIDAAGAFSVGFLREALDRDQIAKLKALETPVDSFATEGREIYWLCRKKQSESEFSNSLFEKKVGARATFRGMNTMAKLAALLPRA